MNNKQKVSRSNTVIYGILFVVFGILLVIISAYIDQAYSDEHNNKNSLASVTQSGVAQQNNSGQAQPNNASQNAVLQQQKQSPFINITASALSTIGVALVGFGIFSILLDLKSWREYFSERLKDVVIEQQYLSGLDNDTLNSLHVKLLKALYKDSSIDKEGGFLNYFQTNLIKYISEPYREAVKAEIELQEERDGCYVISDSIDYTCRKAGGRIQENISWFADTNEFVDVFSLLISIKLPYNHQKAGEEVTLFDGSCDKDKNTFKELKSKPLHISLEEYKDIDQLVVVVKAKYSVVISRFQYWQMAHPTKNFTVVITHPESYVVQLKPLVLEENSVYISENKYSITAKYNSWMLPRSGVSWRFCPKP